MKRRSDILNELIKMEEERRKEGERTTIKMDYLEYLKEKKRLLEIGDIRVDETK